MSLRSLRFGPGVALLAAVLVTACQTAGDAGEAKDIRGPALDLVTLKAVTPEGVFRGEPLENASVGAVDDDWFIGISVPDGTEAGEVVAYLCNGERGIWLAGEIADGAARLQSDDTVLEFNGDGTFSGSECPCLATIDRDGAAGIPTCRRRLLLRHRASRPDRRRRPIEGCFMRLGAAGAMA